MTKNLEKQLDASTSKYLKANTSYNKENTDGSPLMSWFRGDFGYKRGNKIYQNFK
jgi:hypothetical protein